MIETVRLPVPPGFELLHGALDEQVGQPMTSGVLIAYRVVDNGTVLELDVETEGGKGFRDELR